MKVFHQYDGVSLPDVDECAADPGLCSGEGGSGQGGSGQGGSGQGGSGQGGSGAQAVCVNTDGAYRCECIDTDSGESHNCSGELQKETPSKPVEIVLRLGFIYLGNFLPQSIYLDAIVILMMFATLS